MIYSKRGNKVKRIAGITAMMFALFFILSPLSMNQADAASELSFTVHSDSIQGNDKIVVRLTNTTGSAITVSGPIQISPTVEPVGSPPLNFPSENLSEAAGDLLFDGAANVTIPDGETSIVADIAPGYANTWRQHDQATHTLIFTLYMDINGVGTRSNEMTVTFGPSAFATTLELHSNAPVDYAGGTQPIILSLENTGSGTVTIHAPVVVQGYHEWSLDESSKRYVVEELSGGESSIVIPTGETKEIARVEPGPPNSWRNFYSPKVFDEIIAWFSVEDPDSISGYSIWSEAFTYGIVGELVNEQGVHGEILAISDNEDGTAAITALVRELTYGTKVTYDEVEDKYTQVDLSEIGEPLSGLDKSDFAISQMTSGGQQPVGEIMRVRALDDPGKYRLTWSHTNGTHSEIFIDGRHTDPDLADYWWTFLVDAQSHQYAATITISTLNRPLEPTLNTTTNKYESKLEYEEAGVSITFTSDTDFDATINLRQKASTARPLPETGPVPAGLYYDINVGSGDLTGVTILLEIKYSSDDIPPGMNELDLKLFRYNETTGDWDLLPNQEIDTQNKVIRVWLDGFSEFGIFEFATPTATTPTDPTQPAETTQPTESAQIPVPKTGESIPFGQYLIFTMLGIMMMGGLLLRRTLRHKKQR